MSTQLSSILVQSRPRLFDIAVNVVMSLRINNKDVSLPKPYPIIPRQPRQKPMRILALGLSRASTLCT
jgi:hypothetical protein